MNYMKELNAFRDWLAMNNLSTSAVALWYALMSLNNLSRWKEYFNVPSKTICQQTGLSETGALKARKTLIKHGLIECISGKRDQAPFYKMISLIDQAGGVSIPKEERTVEPSVNPTVRSSVNSTENQQYDIHRQRQDETKTNESPPTFLNQKPVKPNSKQSVKKTTDEMTIFDELLEELGS